jgi:hypothetical protein
MVEWVGHLCLLPLSLVRLYVVCHMPFPLHLRCISLAFLFFNKRIHMVIYRNLWAVLCTIHAFILLPDFNMSHA